MHREQGRVHARHAGAVGAGHRRTRGAHPPLAQHQGCVASFASYLPHGLLPRCCLLRADAYTDARFDKAADHKTSFVTKNILTVPVIDAEGKGVAVIQAVNKRGKGHFEQEDIHVLESLAARSVLRVCSKLLPAALRVLTFAVLHGFSAGIILQKSKMYHATVCAEKKSRALMNLLKASNTLLCCCFHGRLLTDSFLPRLMPRSYRLRTPRCRK